MKRFYNSPARANAKFARKAYKIDRMNLKGAFMRGGIRLSF